jgi:hypothetical protein
MEVIKSFGHWHRISLRFLRKPASTDPSNQLNNLNPEFVYMTRADGNDYEWGFTFPTGGHSLSFEPHEYAQTGPIGYERLSHGKLYPKRFGRRSRRSPAVVCRTIGLR